MNNFDKVLGIISEGPGGYKPVRRADWYIMKGYHFPKSKTTIEEILAMDKEYDQTVMVCLRGSGYPVKWQEVFIIGSGGEYGKVGEKKTYIIDTGNGYRGQGDEVEIQNIIQIKKGEIVKTANNVGLKEKRTPYVFK